ncbi:pentapeptide repeat-containing protein [Nostoc flagelliforme FACHB-838]|uniref:Pentapeptide repeat-containing protein n=1 Tax=Nostoc flagelliforme FACHB-838 TaxID=2692904 RepID=A0ABR8DW56_9NOSO|nr:pentapeptide repeat-containing protein [Nostoc flagelliforme]MBD2533449.1 pentapeptide repeat-containing protein [Nostoc flagelliforme FACHB-838]
MELNSEPTSQSTQKADTQVKITRHDLLRMVEENGGPEGLDLSNADLSGIDLSSSSISRDLQTLQVQKKIHLPVWATEIVKTSPSGAAMWKLNLTKDDGAPLSPKEISSSLRYGVNLKGAILSGADLQGANLERAELTGADLVQANLESANLWASVLDNANLWRANLKNAYLAKASFQETIVSNANLENVNAPFTDFHRADFSGANLNNASFYAANLSEAKLNGVFLGRTSLWRANLRDAQISVKSIGTSVLQEDPEAFMAHLEHHLGSEQTPQSFTKPFKRRFSEARDVYLALKANFSDTGDNLAASWAHFKAREMQKHTHHPQRAGFCYYRELPQNSSSRISPRLWWFYFKHTVHWLLSWAAELSCGYGEQPFRVIACSAVILLVFPFLYALVGGVINTSGQPLRWVDYFHYSLAAFSTIGFPDLVPASDVAKLLTSLEALLGIASLSLLMFALGNRISRG